MKHLHVPTEGSRRYFPDLLEVEAVCRALSLTSFRGRFSDAQGRERTASRMDEMRSASGVLAIEGSSVTLVRSDAPFAFAPVRCECGADALVGIDELYKRTHGRAPARILAELGLGKALRGRCSGCRAPLDPDRVAGAPFAHFGVLTARSEAFPALLREATGLGYRVVELMGG